MISQYLWKNWSFYMKKKVSELPGKPFDRRPLIIFRLPSSIHETNKEICEPNFVSIGPYHQGKKNFQALEEHKWYTLRKFLARNENIGLEVYLQAIKSIEADVRNCYSETVDLGSDDFAMMLLLDGCFILEIFISVRQGELGADAFLGVGWMVESLFADLFLCENQLPFFVLHKLWAIQCQAVGCIPKGEDSCPLLQDLCSVLTLYFDDTQFRPSQSCDDIDHLVDLSYRGVLPDFKPQYGPKNTSVSFLLSKLFSKSGKAKYKQTDSNPMKSPDTIPSISELCDAGIKFKRKKRPASMFDISFRNGTIEMPLLTVDPPKMKIFWNMVAFEQIHMSSGLEQILSSYLALMDTLINTGKDVAILEQSGIFENLFQNADDAANFFNQFDRIFGLNYKDHYFKDLFEDVRKYSESTWHKYRARLMQDYFSNPWTIISVVAAGILLILTFIQTYYTASS